MAFLLINRLKNIKLKNSTDLTISDNQTGEDIKFKRELELAFFSLNLYNQEEIPSRPKDRETLETREEAVNHTISLLNDIRNWISQGEPSLTVISQVTKLICHSLTIVIKEVQIPKFYELVLGSLETLNEILGKTETWNKVYDEKLSTDTDLIETTDATSQKENFDLVYNYSINATLELIKDERAISFLLNPSNPHLVHQFFSLVLFMLYNNKFCKKFPSKEIANRNITERNFDSDYIKIYKEILKSLGKNNYFIDSIVQHTQNSTLINLKRDAFELLIVFTKDPEFSRILIYRGIIEILISQISSEPGILSYSYMNASHSHKQPFLGISSEVKNSLICMKALALDPQCKKYIKEMAISDWICEFFYSIFKVIDVLNFHFDFEWDFDRIGEIYKDSINQSLDYLVDISHNLFLIPDLSNEQIIHDKELNFSVSDKPTQLCFLNASFFEMTCAALARIYIAHTKLSVLITFKLSDKTLIRIADLLNFVTSKVFPAEGSLKCFIGSSATPLDALFFCTFCNSASIEFSTSFYNLLKQPLKDSSIIKNSILSSFEVLNTQTEVYKTICPFYILTNPPSICGINLSHYESLPTTGQSLFSTLKSGITRLIQTSNFFILNYYNNSLNENIFSKLSQISQWCNKDSKESTLNLHNEICKFNISLCILVDIIENQIDLSDSLQKLINIEIENNKLQFFHFIVISIFSLVEILQGDSSNLRKDKSISRIYSETLQNSSKLLFICLLSDHFSLKFLSSIDSRAFILSIITCLQGYLDLDDSYKLHLIEGYMAGIITVLLLKDKDLTPKNEKHFLYEEVTTIFPSSQLIDKINFLLPSKSNTSRGNETLEVSYHMLCPDILEIIKYLIAQLKELSNVSSENSHLKHYIHFNDSPTDKDLQGVLPKHTLEKPTNAHQDSQLLQLVNSLKKEAHSLRVELNDSHITNSHLSRYLSHERRKNSAQLLNLQSHLEAVVLGYIDLETSNQAKDHIIEMLKDKLSSNNIPFEITRDILESSKHHDMRENSTKGLENETELSGWPPTKNEFYKLRSNYENLLSLLQLLEKKFPEIRKYVQSLIEVDFNYFDSEIDYINQQELDITTYK